MVDKVILSTMLLRHSFDTICHEHLEYYALRRAFGNSIKTIFISFDEENSYPEVRILCLLRHTTRVSQAIQTDLWHMDSQDSQFFSLIFFLRTFYPNKHTKWLLNHLRHP